MGRASNNGKRILAVEDETAIGKVCVRTLGAEGFGVDIAANGKVALDVLRKKEYGLCFIDINTSKMNGIELYRHLRERTP